MASRCLLFRWLSLFLLIIPVFLSCGGNDEEEPAGPASPGTVAVFITDNISFYKQVIATVNSVSLVNSGTMTSCTVLRIPVTLDLSNLTNIAQFVDAADCPSGLYNSIDIVFQRDIQLMDQNENTSACRFTSYLDDNNQQKPLTCDPSGECRMSIRGAVRQGAVQVLPGRTSDLGIDFDLKQFTVTGFGDSACAVAMKVYSVDAASLNNSGRAHGVTGSISDLDTSAKTFRLSRAGRSFSVDYSTPIPALPPSINIDFLLQTAVDNGLKVKVMGSSINLATNTITASQVFVKVEGTVSDLIGLPAPPVPPAPPQPPVPTVWTFTLTYQTDKTMPVNYMPPAVFDGTPAAGAWVAVSLDGYRSGEYLVSRAEVLPAGMIIED